MKPVGIVQIGLGAIGAGICRLAAQKKGLEIIGAVEKLNVGKDLGNVIGLGSTMGIPITESMENVLNKKPDIAINATFSSLRLIKDQLLSILSSGVNIISTCEELSYPWKKQPDIARELDEAAKKNNVTLLGTGVNPGFCMDTFPIMMTGVYCDVDHIKTVRVQDARFRRLAFQKKIGAGCSPDEFKELINAGTLRHVGLEESADMIAAAMGWNIDDYRESINPVMAEKEVAGESIFVKPGQAAGVEQIAVARMAGREVIRMEFRAYLGAPESYDAVYIKGNKDMETVVRGGIEGDSATAAMTVNAIPRVINAPAGLITMKDLPPVHPYAGGWFDLIL